MAKNPTDPRRLRLQAIFSAGSLEALVEQPGGMRLLEAEAHEKQGLIPPEAVGYLQALCDERRQAGLQFASLSRRADLIIIPGFLGSELRNVASCGSDDGERHGVIWMHPQLHITSYPLSALRLAEYNKDKRRAKGKKSGKEKSEFLDRDDDETVRVDSLRPIPIVYDLLRLDLQLRGHSVQFAPYDWRKDLDIAAKRLAGQIRARLGQQPRPLALVAHSQGALVARRALHLLGAETARRLVSQLVLLGPANFGTMAAAMAITGSVRFIESLRDLHVELPPDMGNILRSFTGLYQLLPWKPGTITPDFDPAPLKDAKFWNGVCDEQRLKRHFGWGADIDTEFFNDRTAIILGDRPGLTAGGVKFDENGLVPDGSIVAGDGTIPDRCAQLPRVTAYRAAGVAHMGLPLSPTVIAAVNAILRGLTPAVDHRQFDLDKTGRPAVKKPQRGERNEPVETRLPMPIPLQAPAPPRMPARLGRVPRNKAAEPTGDAMRAPTSPPVRRSPPEPPSRRLQVFSFDPLLATNLDTLGIAEITIDIPWEADGRLGPGPVGEYVEVVDYDPASNCFYHPVYLSHPRLLAQNGLPPSESNPQFHQQMAYAVSMSTINTFEQALGRKALWAPHIERDDEGSIIERPTEETYVPRLRIYPHALRDANAFYDPSRNALLFGYFSSRDQPGGQTMPGGTVFTCQSFDIVAHETTHALLHGLHRYYFNPSNPDVFAFHEAFADVVALFQHFSHPDVVRHQVARTRGNLNQENLLGQLAQQFGEALGHRGALRQYIGSTDARGQWQPRAPDPELYRTVTEPHDRGAILVAAIFRAFLNIYRNRSRDLFRIATGGTGILPDGDIHPDLVNRLAIEASKSAEHILTMCVRALDYLPPVDLTFGEYLRALITADYDLVRDDDKQYRPAVIDAFRAWGLYPADVNVLDETALRWRPPEIESQRDLKEIVSQLQFNQWNLRTDRRAAFLNMNKNCKRFRSWLYRNARQAADHGISLGVMVFNQGLHSIARSLPAAARVDGERTKSKTFKGSPTFDVHSLRPCCRIGPDGQQQLDLIAEVVQHRAGYFDPDLQSTVDKSGHPWAFSAQDHRRTGWKEVPGKKTPDFWFRGGCTLIIDPATGELRYCIRKRINDDVRLDQQRKFEQASAMPSLAATYFGSKGRNPFAMLHADD